MGLFKKQFTGSCASRLIGLCGNDETAAQDSRIGEEGGEVSLKIIGVSCDLTLHRAEINSGEL